MTPLLHCAALLLSYTGPMPEPYYQDRSPTASECAAAVDADVAHRDGCSALTGGVRGYVVTIMPANAPMLVQVIEAMRAVEIERSGTMTSAQIYRLAERYGECK